MTRRQALHRLNRMWREAITDDEHDAIVAALRRHITEPYRPTNGARQNRGTT